MTPARLFPLLALLALFMPAPASADGGDPPTVVRSRAARARLLGTHAMEWRRSDWTDFGTARIREVNGVLRLAGYLRHVNGRDHLRIEGRVVEVRPRTFTLLGTLAARASLANDGRPFRRDGEMTFRAEGRRGAWRLIPQETRDGEPLGDLLIRFDRVEVEARRARERAVRE